MKNTTIAHLSLASTFHSPLFNRLGNIKISNSLFSRFSASILRNPKSALVSNTAFSKGLSSAIYVNKETYEGKSFTDAVKGHIIKTDEDTDETITIKKCSFTKISPADNYSVIVLKSDYKLAFSLFMTETTFTDCESPKRAAVITASICQITTSRNCISNCKGGKQSAVIDFTTRSGFDLSFNYTTIQNCGMTQSTTQSIVSLDGGLLVYSNNNVTSNVISNSESSKRAAIVLTDSRGSIIITDSTFENNGMIPVLGIYAITPFKDVKRLNFVGNNDEKIHGLISFSYELIISNSVMKNNKGNAYFKHIEDDKYENEQYLVSLIDCQIDEEEPLKDTNINYFSADPKQFNMVSATTFNLDLLNMGVCHGNVVSPESSTNWGTVVIVLILILIFVLAIVGFLLYISDGDIKRLCDKIKNKRQKIPEYEVGLADIQVATEE